MTSVRTGRKSRKSATPFDVANWLAADDSLDIISGFARRVAAFSRAELDDLTSEIVLALLERQHEAPATEGEFLTWVQEVVAEDVAKKLRNADQRNPGIATETDVMAETVAQDDGDDEPAFEFCSELMAHEKKRAARIKRALSKLSESQRQAITDKFFAGKSLAGSAAESEMCDSSHRMRLMRGKRKLAAMIDREGYALAA